ncbi:MAG TPA: hypothetical protein VFL19_05200 [Nitrospira sp.]|nr:hypothetical protein [Nitrospira sp.]
MWRFRPASWHWGWLVVSALLLLIPAMTDAQVMQGIPRSPIETMSGSTDRMPEGYYVMPWVATGVVYDDNVFFTTRDRRQEDVFLRVTPGLQGSYQSTPVTVIANYRFDSEVYHKLTNLSTVQQRQFGTVEVRGRPSSNLNLNGIAGYAQTRTPFELNFLTSAQTARINTERIFVNPSAEYRPDALTRYHGEYGYSRDIFDHNITIDSNIVNLGMERRVGSHDWLGPAYIGRHFTFGGNFTTPTAGFIGGNPDPVNSYAIMASWAHEFSADTRLDVRAGPRLTDGKIDNRPEAFVGIRRRIQNGEVTLAYTSALTTVIGTVGATTTDNVLVRFLYEPMRHLTFTVQPTAAWIQNSAFTSTIYTAYVEAAYQFNKFITAKGSAYFSYQEGDFVSTGGTSQTLVIPRNVYWLRLEFTYPTRWEY